jgi:hypothetical protein
MDGHEAEIQGLIGFFMVWLIQKAKGSNFSVFKFISDGTAGVCRAASALLALGVSAGITWTAMDTETGYDILIHSPHLQEVAHFAVGAAYQYLAQEVQYQALLKPRP